MQRNILRHWLIFITLGLLGGLLFQGCTSGSKYLTLRNKYEQDTVSLKTQIEKQDHTIQELDRRVKVLTVKLRIKEADIKQREQEYRLLKKEMFRLRREVLRKFDCDGLGKPKEIGK